MERADEDPTPAIRFEAALTRALEEVREAPTRWPRLEGEVRRCPLARPFDDWALVYVIDGDIVVVVAVAHAKRRPGFWGGRR